LAGINASVWSAERLGFQLQGPQDHQRQSINESGQPKAASIRRSRSTQPFGGLVSCKPEFGSSVLIDKRCTRCLGFTPRRCTVGLSPSGSVDRAGLLPRDTPRHCGRVRACRSRTLRSPDNTPPTRTRPGLQPPNVCLRFPPRQRERIRVRSSRALRSPDNSRHPGRPRAYGHQTVALPSSSPTRAHPGSQLASAAVTWQLPPTRAPPGLAAAKLLRSLPPRRRERIRARSSRTLRSPDNSRHRRHLRDRGSHELLPQDNSSHGGRPRAHSHQRLRQPPASAGASGPPPLPSCLHASPHARQNLSRVAPTFHPEPSLPNDPVFNSQAQQGHPGVSAQDRRSHARRAHGCVRQLSSKHACRVQT
jgi:hypothetical protein